MRDDLLRVQALANELEVHFAFVRLANVEVDYADPL